MPILVCESLRAASLDGLRRARAAVTSADLVELRLDALADPDPVAALADRTHPVIVTCRPRWEGGGYDGPEDDRRQVLERAVQAGAEFVDVEWRAPWRDAFLARWAERVVLSWHDFEGMPGDLASLGLDMSRSGAAVVKIAVTPRSIRDLGALVTMRRGLPRERRVVVIGMGSAGLLTRLLPQRFGSCWTYAGRGVAPGQIEADRLIREFRVRALTAETAVCGNVEHPAVPGAASAMLNAAFGAARVDAVHVPLDVVDEADFDWVCDALDVMGVSVRTPAGHEPGLHVVHPLRTGGMFRRDGRGGWIGRAAVGMAALDAMDALVQEAAQQFEWWTGTTAPVDVMRQAARRHVDGVAVTDTGSA